MRTVITKKRYEKPLNQLGKTKSKNLKENRTVNKPLNELGRTETEYSNADDRLLNKPLNHLGKTKSKNFKENRNKLRIENIVNKLYYVLNFYYSY